jgi:hypothetical protein
MLRILLVGLLGLIAPSCAAGSGAPAARSAAQARADTAHVDVTRPTVVAYFIVPDGAVDTLPDLAVEADDWNYAMSILGDSLAASDIALALATEPVLRLSSPGFPPRTLALGERFTAGYVFVRPGGQPCLRRGGAEPDAVLQAARAFFARPSRAGARPAERCS